MTPYITLLASLVEHFLADWYHELQQSHYGDYTVVIFTITYILCPSHLCVWTLYIVDHLNYHLYMHIYVIMKAMCPPSYHHNDSVATHALGHMMYGWRSIKNAVRKNFAIFTRKHLY